MSKHTSKKGFTIPEIIVALFIISTIFAGVLPLLYNSINNNKEGRMRLLAYEALNQHLEEMREEKVSSLLAPNHILFTIDSIPNGQGDIYVTKPFADQRIARLDCTVNWSFQDKNHSITVNTYIYGGTQ